MGIRLICLHHEAFIWANPTHTLEKERETLGFVMIKLKIFLITMTLLICISGNALSQTSPGVDIPLPRARPNPPMPAPRLSTTARQDFSVSKGEQGFCPALTARRIDATLKPPISEGVCNIAKPYEVRGIHLENHSIAFSRNLTLTCGMATHLADWLEELSTYAQATYGAPLLSVDAGTSYHCRTRNNVKGAKISEHGRANALDITGFKTQNGQSFSLPKDWKGSSTSAKSMRFAHKQACKHFTTVLGPNANALHYDHLHVDLARHGRQGTYRVCK